MVTTNFWCVIFFIDGGRVRVGRVPTAAGVAGEPLQEFWCHPGNHHGQVARGLAVRQRIRWHRRWFKIYKHYICLLGCNGGAWVVCSKERGLWLLSCRHPALQGRLPVAAGRRTVGWRWPRRVLKRQVPLGNAWTRFIQ